MLSLCFAGALHIGQYNFYSSCLSGHQCRSIMSWWHQWRDIAAAVSLSDNSWIAPGSMSQITDKICAPDNISELRSVRNHEKPVQSGLPRLCDIAETGLCPNTRRHSNVTTTGNQLQQAWEYILPNSRQLCNGFMSNNLPLRVTRFYAVVFWTVRRSAQYPAQKKNGESAFGKQHTGNISVKVVSGSHSMPARFWRTVWHHFF